MSNAFDNYYEALNRSYSNYPYYHITAAVAREVRDLMKAEIESLRADLAAKDAEIAKLKNKSGDANAAPKTGVDKVSRGAHEQFLEKPENRRLYQQEKALIDATELLAEVMEKKQMSRADLARTIGKSEAFVIQVLRGNQNMTLRTLADLFGAMHYEIVIQALPYTEDTLL